METSIHNKTFEVLKLFWSLLLTGPMDVQGLIRSHRCERTTKNWFHRWASWCQLAIK